MYMQLNNGCALCKKGFLDSKNCILFFCKDFNRKPGYRVHILYFGELMPPTKLHARPAICWRQNGKRQIPRRQICRRQKQDDKLRQIRTLFFA